MPQRIYITHRMDSKPIVLQKVHSPNLSPPAALWVCSILQLPVFLYRADEGRLGEWTFCKTMGVAVRSTSDIYSLVYIVSCSVFNVFLFSKNANDIITFIILAAFLLITLFLFHYFISQEFPDYFISRRAWQIFFFSVICILYILKPYICEKF